MRFALSWSIRKHRQIRVSDAGAIKPHPGAMHADIAPVTASIAEQLPRYSLHARQTGMTLPLLAVPSTPNASSRASAKFAVRVETSDPLQRR